jgi:hypothetical protein
MSNYLGGPGPELYYSLPAAVTKNTFTSQAVISAPGSGSIPRCMIPAEYFSQVGKSIHFEANGTIANTSAATFVFAAGLDAAAATIGGAGGATLFTAPSLTPTASTTCLWTMEYDIVCQAVGNLGTTLEIDGELDVSTVATDVWQTSGTKQLLMNQSTLTGLNNEIPLWLELFGTWSASSASNTTTVKQFKVYLEN